MDSPTRQIVARNVRRLRDQRRWTQADLARHTRGVVKQRTVSAVEDPEGPSPTLQTLEALAGAFQIPVWTILIDVDDMDPPRIRALDTVLTSYTALPEDGRSQVNRTLDQEARYAKAG